MRKPRNVPGGFQRIQGIAVLVAPCPIVVKERVVFVSATMAIAGITLVIIP